MGPLKVPLLGLIISPSFSRNFTCPPGTPLGEPRRPPAAVSTPPALPRTQAPPPPAGGTRAPPAAGRAGRFARARAQ